MKILKLIYLLIYKVNIVGSVIVTIVIVIMTTIMTEKHLLKINFQIANQAILDKLVFMRQLNRGEVWL